MACLLGWRECEEALAALVELMAELGEGEAEGASGLSVDVFNREGRFVCLEEGGTRAMG